MRYKGAVMPTPGPSPVTIAFARRLKVCRQAAGFETALEAANALGINQHRYRLYERGLREPPFDLLVKMADTYGKTIDFLIRGNPKP